MTNTTTTNVTATGEKLYKRYDIQDSSDFEIETLQGMREWLADFWNDNPDEDMDDKEHDEMIEAIMVADEDEIYERLGGIDYAWCEVDEDPEELFDTDMTSIEQNFSWGFGIKLLKLDEKTLQVTVKEAEGKIKDVWTTDLPETKEGWDKIFDEQAVIIREEIKNYKTDKPKFQYLG